MSLSTLTSKGQTTIPQEIRKYLKVQAGDQLDFIIQDNEVIVRPATLHVSSLKGILHKKSIKKVSIEEMNQAIKKRAGEKIGRH